MKIKSLLIGSAATMAAVSGAQAADAIVVPEPEPMEYVRVCDVYGAGFFYIPGTETCLKIGGYVRAQVGYTEDNDDIDDDLTGYTRATLTFDARSETEYGTLGGFVELRGQSNIGFYDDGGEYFRAQQAYITLGGFFVGLKTTVWDAGLSGEFDSGGFDDRVHLVGYTFNFANGVHATVELEQLYLYEDEVPFVGNREYAPNVVANIGVTQGWGSFNLWGAYDSYVEEWMAKAIAKVNLTQTVGLELLGTYESDDNWYSVSHPDSVGGYEWSAGGYLKFAATPAASIGFGGQYFADNHFTGNDDWAIGAVLDYTIVQNLQSKIALNYFDGDSADDGHFGGFVRLQRNF